MKRYFSLLLELGEYCIPGLAGSIHRSPVKLLLVSNFIPLAGLFFFDWQIFWIIYIYWAESLVVGLFTTFKILIFSAEKSELQHFIVTFPFYFFHYFGICALLGLFLMSLGALFIEFESEIQLETLSSEQIRLTLFPFLSGKAMDIIDSGIIGIIFFILSHGFSLVSNFSQDLQSIRYSIHNVTAPSYRRLLLIQVLLLLMISSGYIIFSYFGYNRPIALLFSSLIIIVKTVIDSRIHISYHYGVNR